MKYILIILALMYDACTSAIAQTAKADSIAKRHDELMQIIMTKPKVPIKTIGVYVYDGYNTFLPNTKRLASKKV